MHCCSSGFKCHGCSREGAAGALCTRGSSGPHPSPLIALSTSAPSFTVTWAHLPCQRHSTVPVLSAPLLWLGRCLCVLVSIFGCEVGSGCQGWCGSGLWPHPPVEAKEVKHMAALGIAASAGKRRAAASPSAGPGGSDRIKCLSSCTETKHLHGKSQDTANSITLALFSAIEKGTTNGRFSLRVFLDEFCHRRMHHPHPLLCKNQTRGRDDQG